MAWIIELGPERSQGPLHKGSSGVSADPGQCDSQWDKERDWKMLRGCSEDGGRNQETRNVGGFEEHARGHIKDLWPPELILAKRIKRVPSFVTAADRRRIYKSSPLSLLVTGASRILC